MFTTTTTLPATPAVELKVTNGHKGVSLIVAEVGHPLRTESVAAVLTPDQALLTGLALILGDLNVQAGDHDNNGNALAVEHLDEGARLRLLYAIAAEAQTARANWHTENARQARIAQGIEA